MRKPPPISTSSPRETMTSRPAGERREHEQRRRRVVVDDDRRFGAGQAAEQRLGVHVAPPARAAAQVVFERRVASRDLGDATRWPTPTSGARPRFVWMMTPVALMTGCSDGRNSVSRAVTRPSASIARDDRRLRPKVPASPPAMADRASAAAARRASTVASAPNRASSARTAGALAQPLDRRNRAEVGHRRNGMLSCSSSDQADDCGSAQIHDRSSASGRTPSCRSSRPPPELAALDPDLHEALFGAQQRPFSITLVFPALDVPAFAAALELARASAEFRETGTGDGAALPRPLLVERRRQAARSRFRSSAASDADRGPHRRSAGAVRARALAAARLVPHPAVSAGAPSQPSIGI